MGLVQADNTHVGSMRVHSPRVDEGGSYAGAAIHMSSSAATGFWLFPIDPNCQWVTVMFGTA